MYLHHLKTTSENFWYLETKQGVECSQVTSALQLLAAQYGHKISQTAPISIILAPIDAEFHAEFNGWPLIATFPAGKSKIWQTARNHSIAPNSTILPPKLMG